MLRVWRYGHFDRPPKRKDKHFYAPEANPAVHTCTWQLVGSPSRRNICRHSIQSESGTTIKKPWGNPTVADPEVSKGKPLPIEVEERVRSFYESDEHSRLLPGAKDYKSVKSSASGQRERKQKRLLLMNLNELYSCYKAKFPNDQIGVSKFCMLRPAHCITVGNRAPILYVCAQYIRI